VIDNSPGCLWPSSENCGENIIVAFSLWDAVEAIAYAMCTPYAHNASCETLFTIGRVIQAFCTTISTIVILEVISEVGILRTVMNLGHTIMAATLK